MKLLDRYTGRRQLLAINALFFSYVATAVLGMYLHADTSPALIWPPAGIAVAVLFLEGLYLAPVVALASLVSNLLGGVTPLVALGLAVANMLQAVVGVYLLRHLHFEPLLARLRDTFVLIATALLASMVTPLLGTLVLLINSPAPTRVWALWEPWWIGEMLSVLIIGTLVIRWFIRWPTERTKSQILEWLVSFALLMSLCYLLFWTPYALFAGVPLVYTILIPLIWMALRIGPRGMTLALFIMTALSLVGTVYGHTHTATALPAHLMQIEIFDLIIAMIFLIFISSEEGRKLATRSLREHVSQLENALQKISSEDRAKNEFLAILAHELRNPLAPVLSSLELLKLRGPDAPGTLELVDTMSDRVKIMARLLDDLLDISRISQKKFKLQKETVDLGAVLRQSLETAETVIKNSGHRIVAKLPSAPLWLSADPVRLEQIFVNLLNNAAKYTEQGGTIEVTCTRDKDHVAVHVRDNGIGIEKNMLTRIFEPFLQVERSKRTEGLGIGLSLTKRLVEMHSGKIEAHSEGLGRGSEFIVQLPTPLSAVQLPIPIRSRLRRSPKAPERTLKILVVDDNRLAAEGLGKLLAHKGHPVALAYDAAEALESAAQFDPHVIVLDIGLPDMSGYTLAQKLRTEAGSKAFLIALTGYGQEDDKTKAQSAGFDRHLTKPISLAELEAVLATVPASP